eukprot:558807_1
MAVRSPFIKPDALCTAKAKFIWRCHKCHWYQSQATITCRECNGYTSLTLHCNCGTINDMNQTVCSSCNRTMKIRKSLREVLLQDDTRQIGVFLGGCCNINSYETNLSLLFDGITDHSIGPLPDDIINLCVSYCFNWKQLHILVKQRCDVWDTYPYTSHLATLNDTASAVTQTIWSGRNVINSNTLRVIWRLQVSKSKDMLCSFTIGISKTDYTKNYQFRVMNGSIKSVSKMKVKNNDVISMVYVKYECTECEAAWKGKIKLYVNDVMCPKVIETDVLYFEYFKLEVQLFTDMELRILSELE